jgi:hypothetical protein
MPSPKAGAAWVDKTTPHGRLMLTFLGGLLNSHQWQEALQAA